MYKRKSTSTESSDAVAEHQSSASSDDAKPPSTSASSKRSSKKAKREPSDDGEKSRNKRTENGPQAQQNDQLAAANSSTSSNYRPLKIKLKKAAAPLTNSVSGASDVNAASHAESGNNSSTQRSPPHAKPLLSGSDACDLNPVAVVNAQHCHPQLDFVSSVHPVPTGPAPDMRPCWTLLGDLSSIRSQGRSASR